MIKDALVDIQVLLDMIVDAQEALEAHGRSNSGRDSSNVFTKIRAAGDVCIDNNDLNSNLKKLVPLTSQYSFKQAAFALRQLSTLDGGHGGNQVVKTHLHNMKVVYENILNSNIGEKMQAHETLASSKSKKVFIVHGHDELSKINVARFLEKVGLEPIILHEQASSSKTIIEKIEAYSDVGFAVVIYSPCDVGGKASTEPCLKPRARQNVVFEHGYFIGHLGRPNVCALVKGDNLDTPNDISGVVYAALDDRGAWKMDLAKELIQAGYVVDLAKAI